MLRFFLIIIFIIINTFSFAADRAIQIHQMKTEQRVALLIGNADYKSDPLRNPINDVRAMDSMLTSLGFDIIKVENATQREMDEAISQFGKKISNSGVGLFYYAGHGIQVSGENYLVPVGANIEVEGDVKYKAVNVGTVLAKMEAAGNRLNVVLLDACRNNPFARSWRSANKGLAKADAPKGTFIAYATAPGSVAGDGAGNNSFFTEALLRAMKIKGLTIENVLKQVRKDVDYRSSGKQIPWSSSSLIGDFYFILPNTITAIEAQNSLDKNNNKESHLAPKEDTGTYGKEKKSEKSKFSLKCDWVKSLNIEKMEYTPTSGSVTLIIELYENYESKFIHKSAGFKDLLFNGSFSEVSVEGANIFIFGDKDEHYIKTYIEINRLTGEITSTKYIDGDSPGLIFYGNCNKIDNLF